MYKYYRKDSKINFDNFPRYFRQFQCRYHIHEAEEFIWRFNEYRKMPYTIPIDNIHDLIEVSEKEAEEEINRYSVMVELTDICPR